MPIANELKVIAGAQELFDWFGYWPTFHDAEIVSLHLNRRSPSSLLVHRGEPTGKVDERGFYVLGKHVVVEFVFEDIIDLNLGDFSHQNVISSLHIEKKDEGFIFTLAQCYGLAGTIDAKKVSIRLNPGRPLDCVEDE